MVPEIPRLVNDMAGILFSKKDEAGRKSVFLILFTDFISAFPALQQDIVVRKALKRAIIALNNLKILPDTIITLYNKPCKFRFFVNRHFRSCRPIVIFVLSAEKFALFDAQTGLGKECFPLLRIT